MKASRRDILKAGVLAGGGLSLGLQFAGGAKASVPGALYYTVDVPAGQTLTASVSATVTGRGFYYVRVLENPVCRWSTWDAIRAGETPRSDLSATIQERAWSSPIWYSASSKNNNFVD